MRDLGITLVIIVGGKWGGEALVIYATFPGKYMIIKLEIIGRSMFVICVLIGDYWNVNICSLCANRRLLECQYL